MVVNVVIQKLTTNPIPVVQKELPEKITFYESLSVAELSEKITP